MDPREEAAQGLGACCNMCGVGQVPCMALGEGHPHDEGGLLSLFLSLLTGLVGIILLLVLLVTRCHHLGHSCVHVHALAHPSLDASRPSLLLVEEARCPLEVEPVL